MSLHPTLPVDSLGADILLARHGDRIVAWSTDRRADLTLVQLQDGSSDSAPNHLEGVAAPRAEREVTAQASPARRAWWRWRRYQADQSDVSRAEVRSLVKLGLAWLLVSGAITAVLVWVLATQVSPETLEMMVNSQQY